MTAPPSYNATVITLVVDNNTSSGTVLSSLPFTPGLFRFSVSGAINPNIYEIGFDELYIWNRSLSTLERTSLYSNGTGYFYPFASLPATAFRIVSGVTLTNSGLNYIVAPLVSFDAPTGGGETAAGYAQLVADTGRTYADSFPAFSVGNTNNVISTTSGGTGKFSIGNNDFLRVGNVLHDYDWSVFFNFTATGNKQTGVSNVLLSTMDSVNQKSGLIFGINDVNKLFFEYIDTSHSLGGQRRIFVLNQELGENNIVSVSADSIHQTVSICYHSLAKQVSYGMNYNAPGYVPSETLYLGGFTNSTNDVKYTGFIGIFKDVLVLSGAANAIQLNALAPLFCLTGYVPEGQIPVYTYYPIITGATFVEAVATTGITGYSINLVNLPDKDGVDIPVYDLLSLTGNVSGNTVVFYSGTSSGIQTTYSGVSEVLYYDYNYVKNYGDSNFVMLEYEITTGDLIQAYSFDDKWMGKISVLPNIFNIYDYYLSEDFDSSNANVYYNGLLQITGIDYELTSGKIISDSLAEYKSVYSYLLYDEISGTTIISGWTGWSGQYTAGGNLTSGGALDIYLNGQKLISGIDYKATGSYFTLTGTQFGQSVSWASGTFAFVPARTGNRHTFTGTGLGYWHDFSSTLGKLMDEMIYVNGQRLVPGVDYTTVSSGSLLNTDYRPGGWPQFSIYSGELLNTGITAQLPSTTGVNDTLISLTPPTPIT